MINNIHNKNGCMHDDDDVDAFIILSSSSITLPIPCSTHTTTMMDDDNNDNNGRIIMDKFKYPFQHDESCDPTRRVRRPDVRDDIPSIYSRNLQPGDEKSDFISGFRQSSMVTIDICPALRDNYMYLISDPTTKVAAVVDPVEPQKLISKAAERGVDIKYILTTHSHWDHAGGNNKMTTLVPSVEEVYGGVGDGVEGCTKEVNHGDEILVGSIKVTVLFTPCHTPGHVSYFIDQQENVKQPAVFPGDTLFVGGCGNFNSGTPDQMYHAMCKVLAKLPPSTLVYCGHEYTKRNLSFAAYAEPSNQRVREKLAWCDTVKCTIPSTIASELETNPFIRVHEKTIQDFTNETDPIKGIFKVRKLKDSWGKTHL